MKKNEKSTETNKQTHQKGLGKMNVPNETTLAKWANMTDQNAHGLVCEEIAKWIWHNCTETEIILKLDCIKLEESFGFINRLHAEKGSLSYELAIIRNQLTNRMLDCIKSVDRVVYEKICDCL